MNKKDEELILELPQHIVEKSCGFSFDMGGSATKVLYRHKDDWKEFLQQEKASKAKVRLRIFARDKFDEMVAVLKENCDISDTADSCGVTYVTGLCSAGRKSDILNNLGVRIECWSELDCFSNAFWELSHQLDREQFEYLPSEELKEELRQITNTTKLSMSRYYKMSGADNASSASTLAKLTQVNIDFKELPLAEPICDVITDMFPCLMYLISSASAIIRINGASDCEVITPILNGGKIFLGLGSLLCGSKKTYDELIDLAERGDNLKVDQTRRSLLPPGTGDLYSRDVAELYDEVVYSFGEAANFEKDSFKREDLIRSLLISIIRSQMSAIYPTLLASGLRHVFIVGSFTNRELVRKIMHLEFARFKPPAATTYGGMDCDPQIHFMKTAGYLGCIGAFLHNSDSSTKA